MTLSSYHERSRFIKKLILWAVIFGGVLALLFSQTIVSAQGAKPLDPCEIVGGCITNVSDYKEGTTADSVTKLVIDVSRFLVYIAAAVAVLFIVVGGYRMIASNGNAESYKTGLNILLYAIIGLVIAIASFTIISVVGNIVSTANINQRN